MITGNKGEWSEIYALFKLLGDKELHLGDKEIKKIKGIVYPILKILRFESNGDFEYSIEDEFVFVTGNKNVLKIPIETFKEKALFLLEEIKKGKRKGAFSIPEIEQFMYSVNCLSLKAKSTAKTDITIVVHDQRTNQQPTLGFSIKSQLGSPSTLLNAGKTTNFIYEIENFNTDENQIEKINKISTRSKIKDRLQEIKGNNGILKFQGLESENFGNNLILIDSCLPKILSEMVCCFFTSNKSKVSDLVEETYNNNPLDYNLRQGHPFYEYKIKRFLTDIALGMMPSKVWTGEYDATGGYLVVKEDGDVLCYHIYNKNEFENYLLNNTKLETASSSRYDYGTIYKEDGKLYIKLNLQIRFIK